MLDNLKNMKLLLELFKEKNINLFTHSIRVSQYCFFIGSLLELENSQLELLMTSALFHDIGKLLIPNSILDKPSNLTEMEYNLIKQHPQQGSDLLKFYENSDVCSIVLHHHERFNGSGYPNGIAGEKIPLLARIISIADGFDAMTTQRSYNKIKTFYEAIDEILANAGKQYDPKIANQFFKALTKKREDRAWR